MAAIITQQPDLINLAYMPNVWVLTTATGLAAYEVQVNGVTVATGKQPHNPAGVAQINVSKILQSYLETQYIEKIQKVQRSKGEILEYQLRYGEINTTTGVTTWAGYSATKYVVNGYENWRQLNWDFEPFRAETIGFLCEILPPVTNTSSPQKRWLTNWPLNDTIVNLNTLNYTIRSNEYQTLSFFNWLDNRTIQQNADQPWLVEIDFYNAAGGLIGTSAYSINDTTGLGPRINCNHHGPMAYEVGERIGHVGVGTQNLKDGSLWIAGAASYDVQIWSMDECAYQLNGPISDCSDTSELLDFRGSLLYRAKFRVEDDCTPFEPIRISFMNQYGMRDYYTFDRRNTRTVQTQRTNYDQYLGTWNSTSFSIPEYGRGRKTFSSQIVTQMALSTNWMPDSVSKWLEELYTSPDAMIYVDGQWEPCTIVTTEYQQKTNARDKMFQHQIIVEFANNKTVQRG